MSLLSSHYRQPLNLTDETLRQSQSTLDRFYRNLKKNESIIIDVNPLSHLPDDFLESLCDDLNTSKAIAVMTKISKKLSLADENSKKDLKGKLLACGYVLGILQDNPDHWLGVNRASNDIDIDSVETLISKRNLARKNKNFKEADNIRKTLHDMGVEIEDTPTETTWRSIKK